MDVRHEIQHKMVQTLKTWYKLTPLWTTVVCSKKWRLQVYDAIIRNNLLYGLETVHLTQSLHKKVNAFQPRELRKNLGINTTYMNRAHTNEFVLRKANEAVGVRPGGPPKIKLFSTMLQNRRIKLAGHILRSDNRDPLRNVSYQPDSAETFNVGKRRVGALGNFGQLTQYAWENRLNKENFENTTRQNTEILHFARSRQF